MGAHQTKETLHSKGNQQNEETTHWVGERIWFRSDTSDKGLYAKFINNSQNSKNTQTIQFKKWAKDLNRHFSKKYLQMANRHMERGSNH